jgi:FAD/FMN-containing dehydrogenase
MKYSMMNRREFIQLTGHLLPKLALLFGTVTVAACQQFAPMQTATPSPLLAPSMADWRELMLQLSGDLLWPDNRDYVWRAKPANSWFDDITPGCVICPATTTDLQHILAFVKRFNLPFRVRGGGHSYIGASSTDGVLLDMHRFDRLDLQQDVAVVGAGRLLGDIYAFLGQQQRAIPAGSCASVGVVGLMSGGGLGIADRVHGLTCDALLSAEVVLADGQIVHCDAQQHADLFWALRGGCAANFAIVTELRFKTFATAPIRNYIARYKLSNAEQVLKEWQRWALQLPDAVWTQAAIWVSKDSQQEPEVQIRCCSIGDLVTLTTQWQALERRLAALWSNIDVQDHEYLDFMLSDCKGLEAQMCKLPHQSPDARLKRVAMAGSCDLFNRAIGKKGLRQLVLAMQQLRGKKQSGAVLLTLMGGAIAKVDLQATAFVHRQALLSAQYLQIYPAGTDIQLKDKAQQWAHGMRGLMRPWSSGLSYINYADRFLKAPQSIYFGQHYARLKQVKQQYDPQRLFQPPQGV